MHRQIYKKDVSSYSDIIDVDSLSETKSKITTQLVKTENWVINDHNISTCYTPGDNIYINVISNSTYKNYDGVIRETNLDMGLELFYTLVTRSFDSNSTNLQNLPNKSSQHTYTLSWQFDTNSLRLTFSTVLDGFYPITQTIQLNEKILSGDKVLTLKLTEMESKHQAEISELKQQIYELENKGIIFAFDPNNFGKFFKLAPNTEIIDFEQATGYHWLGNYMDFNNLTRVKKIIIGNNNFGYTRTVNDITYNSNCGYNYMAGNNGIPYYLNFLFNIFDSPQIFMPSVLELEVKFKDGSQIPSNTLRSLPNLMKLSFNGYGNNQLNSFELVKQIPKLKQLEFWNCLNVQHLDQIKNWCGSKNIKLELK
jgi:hypothetical protein